MSVESSSYSLKFWLWLKPSFSIPIPSSKVFIMFSTGMIEKSEIYLITRNSWYALAGIITCIRGKCITICRVFMRPHRKSIGPDRNKFIMKLRIIETLVVSVILSFRLIIICVKEVWGIILGADIVEVLSTAIDCIESVEKKKIGFTIFILIMSLSIPYEMYSGFSNITWITIFFGSKLFTEKVILPTSISFMFDSSYWR